MNIIEVIFIAEFVDIICGNPADNSADGVTDTIYDSVWSRFSARPPRDIFIDERHSIRCIFHDFKNGVENKPENERNVPEIDYDAKCEMEVCVLVE